ncbi:hypothetical protein Nepgr_018573 [Nepenthes gracilis]|uniref:Uncharacterized protein n=1 Tax=Nepenthes gracilis TaxID=150966 RepID=A0AAD3STB5_NEPGR|nr:hypothetical protein Nepgr_018573 [Nepenthes gracilis]
MVNHPMISNHPASLPQSGVSEVIYFVEKRFDNSDSCYIASHKLLSMAGVKASPCSSVEYYVEDHNSINFPLHPITSIIAHLTFILNLAPEKI